MARSALLVLVGVALAAWTRDGGAICARGPDAEVLPFPLGNVAPRNARPRVVLDASWRTRAPCQPGASCGAGPFGLVVRAAPPHEGAAIDAVLRESIFGDVASIELAPRALLSARTRYEIVRTSARSPGDATVIGTFATSEAIDDHPPIWAGVASHEVVGYAPKARKPGEVTWAGECAGPGVAFVARSIAVDDRTPPDQMRYGVWAADVGADLDYARPPLAYVRAGRDDSRPPKVMLLLGGGESDGTFALVPGKKVAKVGLRAVDLAGNVSAPSEVTVTLP